MVKVRIEQVIDGDEDIILVGDVYDVAKEIWMIEHLGLSKDNSYNDSKIEIDCYRFGYKINKYVLPSDFYCQEKYKKRIIQSYPVFVTWIEDLDSVCNYFMFFVYFMINKVICC